jgi:hypothetical protein
LKDLLQNNKGSHSKASPDHQSSEHSRLKEIKSTEKVSEKINEKTPIIVVDQSDIEAEKKMSKAIDEFVFKKQAQRLTQLCRDPRFDCYINDRLFPIGRKLKTHKVPPFLSGSKMGLHDEQQVRVKYDFYP